ncbi:hypothetical protein L484_022593 [Morus notabilis]|uniref:Uncharacterized protein n=1 Tax=Morus notabilis TaxID=981085 RepID=W9RIW6_9ROSA|nr:hypothetical protein L484_022593 [Morus notabilis]
MTSGKATGQAFPLKTGQNRGREGPPITEPVNLAYPALLGHRSQLCFTQIVSIALSLSVGSGAQRCGGNHWAGSFLIELDGKLAVRNSSGQGEEWGHPCGINPINGNLAVSQGLTTALNGACFQNTIPLFPFFGATFFFLRDGVGMYNNLFFEDAREQLLGQLRKKCWNLMGKDKVVGYISICHFRVGTHEDVGFD